jgi:ferritin-like metal-binding protein YciE
MALLGSTIETPQDLYVHKLGAALKMENTILDMLPELEGQANETQLKQSLRQHYEQTQRHVANLEQAFQALGVEVDDKPCPAIEGIEKEGQALIKKAEDGLVDAVILSGATDTEHHEISVYEGLMTKAEAMGDQDVVALLQENLEQEQHTLEEVKRASRQLAQELAQQTV